MRNDLKPAIAEVSEAEETLRKEKKTMSEIPMQTVTTNPNRHSPTKHSELSSNEIDLKTPPEASKHFQGHKSNLPVPISEELQQPTPPQTRTSVGKNLKFNSDPVERAFNRHNLAKHAVAIEQSMQQTSPSDPEKVAKVSLEAYLPQTYHCQAKYRQNLRDSIEAIGDFRSNLYSYLSETAC